MVNQRGERVGIQRRGERCNAMFCGSVATNVWTESRIVVSCSAPRGVR